MSRVRIPHLGPLASLVLAALCLLAAAAPASTARTRRHPRPARPAAHATRLASMPAAPHMTISIEPETGALVPYVAASPLRLSAAEQTGLLRSAEGLRQVRLPNGTVMMGLQGRFMEFAVARVGPDGRMRLGCVNDERALRQALATPCPAAGPTPLEER